jgi:CyaY protein
MTALTDQAFRVKADETLDAAQRALGDWADRDGFEVELQEGVLNVFFEEPSPARFVISPNAPVRQIWVSALVRSYKLAWDESRAEFVLDGDSLETLLRRLIRQHLDS